MSSSVTTELRAASAPNRIAALDGMRGFAVLWVMLFHFVHGADHHQWLLRGVFDFLHYGYWGVDVFFVLSGFLITGILYDSKSAGNYFSSFYARRALRILPLYYVVLIGVFLIAPFFVTLSAQQKAMWHEQGWLWIYCGNLAMTLKGASIYDAGGIKLLHLWSLAIEEQFYLIWPAVVFLCSRRRLMQVCVALVAVAMISRVTLDHMGFNPQTSAYFTLSRVDGLSIGALAAMLARGKSGLAPWRGAARWLALICAALLAIALFAQSHDIAADLARNAISLVRLGLFVAVLVLAVTGTRKSWTTSAFSMRWLRVFGKYSYALYVFHYMLLPLFDRFLSTQTLTQTFHSFTAAMLVRVVACTAISFLAALMSWNLLESPILKLKPLFAARPTNKPRQEARQPAIAPVTTGADLPDADDVEFPAPA